MQLHVLFEDNHLLVLSKPAGLATMGVSADRPSLLEEARKYIKHKYKKPGNVYLGIVSRLDAPVSGVILLARTSKAAARLTEQFRLGTVEKLYWTVVEGRPEPDEAACVDWLRKDERHRRMHVAAADHPDARQARLRYRVLGQLGENTHLEVRLDTGRKHQIRLQLATRGWPIVGDRKYGARTRFASGIALHSRQLTINHPVRREPMQFTAALPASWQRFGLK